VSHGPSPSEAAPRTDRLGPSADADLWERRLAAIGRLPGPHLEDAASPRNRQ
jgi:hypothetical protein